MERIIDRFDKYMKYRNLNDNQVTVAMQLSVGTLGKSRKEGRDLSKPIVLNILHFYKDLDKVWLMTGEGQMLKPEVSETNNPKILTNKGSDDMEKMRMRIAHLEEQLSQRDERILELKDRIEGQKEIIASLMGNSDRLKQTAT